MKRKWINHAQQVLKAKGYKFTERWRILYGWRSAFTYCRKGKNYYAVTVSTCTGQLVVEVLKRKELFYISDNSLDL